VKVSRFRVPIRGWNVENRDRKLGHFPLNNRVVSRLSRLSRFLVVGAGIGHDPSSTPLVAVAERTNKKGAT
jgi:hypothetical protein